MTARILVPSRGRVKKGVVPLSGMFTIGSSGAVSSEDGSADCGAAVTKTASETGRYTVTVYQAFTKLRGPTATMEGPADSAFPTTTGSDPQARNVGTTSFDIQFKRVDTQADAEPASGTKVHWSVNGVI